MTLTIPKITITDFLLPTENILYHGFTPSEGKRQFIPFLTVVLLLSFISPAFILLVLPEITLTAIIVCIFLIAIGILLIRMVMWPVTSDNTTKNTEIMITNQRVLIYPSPYAEKNRPKIIYLYEVNGNIEMKYNRASETGNIYIPSPHWDRLYLGRRASGKANPYPDIKGIKDPFKVYDILIEAIEAGKRSKWK